MVKGARVETCGGDSGLGPLGPGGVSSVENAVTQRWPSPELQRRPFSSLCWQSPHSLLQFAFSAKRLLFFKEKNIAETPSPCVCRPSLLAAGLNL